MQLPWKHGRIRLKNTRESASPTRLNSKENDEFPVWLAMYRERLERVREAAGTARAESRKREGTV